MPDTDLLKLKKEDKSGNNGPPRNMALTPDRPQIVRLQSNQIDSSLDLLLGPEGIGISDGMGGWVEIERANDVSISDWPGVPGFKIAANVMVDHWTAHDLETKDSVRVSLNKLMKVSRDIKGDASEPPALRMYAQNLPDFLNGELYVIQTVGWGGVLFDEELNRRRQELNITFMEYSKADTIKLRKRKKRGNSGDNKGGGGGKNQKYTVKRGDTLMSIANKFYGDYDKWKKIAKRNKIRNPRQLEVGTKLIIP